MAKERSSMESLVTSRRVSKDFWKNKKVFLTGHTGFKGSWLSMWLNQLGADVYGYSLEAPTTPSLFDELNLSKHIKSYKKDKHSSVGLLKVVNRRKKLLDYLKRNKIESYKEVILKLNIRK